MRGLGCLKRLLFAAAFIYFCGARRACELFIDHCADACGDFGLHVFNNHLAVALAGEERVEVAAELLFGFAARAAPVRAASHRFEEGFQFFMHGYRAVDAAFGGFADGGVKLEGVGVGDVGAVQGEMLSSC
jgi:hypothetical protein